jgi:hypothetical protein
MRGETAVVLYPVNVRPLYWGQSDWSKGGEELLIQSVLVYTGLDLRRANMTLVCINCMTGFGTWIRYHYLLMKVI